MDNRIKDFTRISFPVCLVRRSNILSISIYRYSTQKNLFCLFHLFLKKKKKNHDTIDFKWNKNHRWLQFHTVRALKFCNSKKKKNPIFQNPNYFSSLKCKQPNTIRLCFLHFRYDTTIVIIIYTFSKMHKKELYYLSECVRIAAWLCVRSR